MADIEYKPSKTGSEFLDDDSFFRGIVGPIGCLAGETLIVTEQGPRRIDSLDAPTKVLSWCARTRKYVFTLASPAFIKGNSALYHVRTPYGEWRAAGHHRVLCREGVYARVDTLLRGRDLHLHPPFEVVTESKGVVGNVLSSITKVVLLCAGVVRGGAIKSVEVERLRSDYWDMQVPDTNNYVTIDGTVHHNSGKSVLCAITAMQMAHDVPPDLQGRRRSRIAVVRNTFRVLSDTTMQTLFEWFPQHDPANGFEWHAADMTWTVTNPQTKFQTEWLFRALDRPDHVRKLLSLELTFAWLNEAREIPLSIVDMLQGRLGRFPSMKDYGWQTDPEVVAALLTRMNETGYVPVTGVDVPYWYGMLGDTNPCDVDHWWYKQFEEARPAGWKVFHQPGATSPNAENLENLHPLYYHRLSQGKTDDWTKIYVNGEYGFVQSGRPVYPEYSDSIHTIDDIKPDPNVPVVLGGDGGLTPACVFAQNFGGNWVVLAEFVCERLGAVNFGREVRKILDTTFRGCTVGGAWFDPSGGKGSSMIDENETVIEILNDMGVPFQPSPDASNGETRRREAVASVLTVLGIDGKPRLRVCRRASHLRKALAGAFHYRRLQVAGVERYKDSRDKNQYSHVAESLEYLLVGEGEGFELADRPEIVSGHNRQYTSPRVRRSMGRN